MSEIEKMKRYIERTGMDENDRYSMNLSEIRELGHEARRENAAMYTAICLAFDYGKAKGYRAAKAEVRRE